MATHKKLMTLLSQQGVLEQRAEIVNRFTEGRTSSTRELTQREIDDLVFFFEDGAEIQANMDKKRKRLIAAIFGVFSKMNKKVSMDYVKGVACQAAKSKSFNQIPEHRLDSLYAAFLKAQKDLNFTSRIVEGYILEQQSYN